MIKNDKYNYLKKQFEDLNPTAVWNVAQRVAGKVAGGSPTQLVVDGTA